MITAPAAGRASRRWVSEMLRSRSVGGAAVAIVPSEGGGPGRGPSSPAPPGLGQRRPFAASPMTASALSLVTKPGPVMTRPWPLPVGRFRVSA